LLHVKPALRQISRSVGGLRGAQRAQQVAHVLRAVGHAGDLALDAQLVVAGQLDGAVLLHQLDDLRASIGGLGRKTICISFGPASIFSTP
jgi:hypothetical protein